MLAVEANLTVLTINLMLELMNIGLATMLLIQQSTCLCQSYGFWTRTSSVLQSDTKSSGQIRAQISLNFIPFGIQSLLQAMLL